MVRGDHAPFEGKVAVGYSAVNRVISKQSDGHAAINGKRCASHETGAIR